VECAAQHGDSFSIATACPAVVNYIERYRPDLVGALVPVCSPMVAHARMLKALLGEGTRVVFVGPCVAKKQEAGEKSGGAVDFALTFTEMLEWLELERVALSILEESDFDMVPEGWARSFPLAGGSLQTASLSTSLLAADVLSVTGTQEVKDTLDREPTSLIAPPKYTLEGVDLVTEGAVTLNQLCNILDVPEEEFEETNPVTELADLLAQADRVNFILGRGANPANDSMGFRQQGIIKREAIVRLLVKRLRAQGKLVTVNSV
jgi:hypothetical protein